MFDISKSNIIKKLKKANKNKIIVLAIGSLFVILAIITTIALVNSNNKKIYEIGKEVVKEDEAAFYSIRYIKGYSLYDTSEFDKEYAKNVTYDDYYKKEILEEIRDTKLLYLCAINEGVKLNNEDSIEIQKNVDDIIAIIGKDVLDKYGIKDKTIKKVITEEYYGDKVKSELTKDIESDDKEIYIHYYNILFRTVEVNENGYIITDAKGNLSYIDESKKTSQKERADEAYEKLIQGTSASEVVKEYNIKMDCKDQYNTEKGLTKSCKKAIGNISEGQYTNVYEDEYGYNIALLISLDDEEYGELISDFNNQTSKESAWEELREELLVKLNVGSGKVYDKNWDRISLKNYIIEK